MKRTYISIVGLFVILFTLPEYAFAYDFIWTNRPEDRSIMYLGQIFGSVGSALPGVANSTVSELFKIFNIAVLSLGAIVVSYTIVLSTINTAQEGEVMGKKWSSVWIPLRAAMGMAMLIPTTSGYSLIQVLMMQIVVYGVAAANQVWAVTVASIGAGTGVFAKTSVEGDRAAATLGLMKSMVCRATIEFDPNCKISFSNKKASAYIVRSADKVQLMVGLENDPNYYNVCGGMESVGGSTSYTSLAAVLNTNKDVMLAAAGTMKPIADNFVENGSTTGLASTVASVSSTIADGISKTPLLTPVDVQSTDALKNGWLFAGAFYFELVKASNFPKFTFPKEITTPLPTSVATDCQSAIYKYVNNASAAVPAGTGAAPTGGSTLNANSTLVMQRSGVDSHVGGLYDLIANAVKGATVDVMMELTKGTKKPDGTYYQMGEAGFVDPVSAMRNFGSSIMITCENLWFAIILAAFLVLILGCIMSGMNPLCWALGAMISILTPILTLIIGLLWGAGAAIGIYLPMVPYLVFTFTALGWMLLVIETMAAAPVVALGLVSPAQENLGKASASVMLITNVFLRPSLMVIGFVIAVKLVTAAITMVNYGFMATVNASTGNIGIFGCIALLCLYGGMCIGIIHECFSLVYVLPDKITRWIGGQAEQSSGIKQQLDEAKGAVDKGAEIGGGLMKSSAGAMSKVAKQSMGGGGITDIASG